MTGPQDGGRPQGPFAPPTLQTLPDAVQANVRRVRESAPVPMMAVIKADGYGHGAVAVARAALEAGAQSLGTTDITEAAALRGAGLTVPILSWLNPGGVDAEAAVRDRVEVAVGSAAELRELCTGPNPGTVRVHLHVDTGMSRGGSPRREWDELLAVATAGVADGRIEVVGLMGHLPHADQGEPAANAEAVRRMHEATDAAAAAGFTGLTRHLGATAAALTDPATHFDLVRVGAGLVGIDPSERVRLHGAGRLTASVVHSHRAAPDTAVGYGGVHVTDCETGLSVLGLGYADGIPREVSADAAVQIDGRRHRIVGRVSMDQIVVDTGERTYPRGTIATVFGPDDGVTPTIQDWARWAGTIPHTIVTGIGPRVRRVR